MPNIAAGGDALALAHTLAPLNVTAIPSNMDVPAQRAVTVVDHNQVARRFKTVALMPHVDPNNRARAGRTNVRADGHGEIVSEFFLVAMADDASIALAAQESPTTRPRQPR